MILLRTIAAIVNMCDVAAKRCTQYCQCHWFAPTVAKLRQIRYLLLVNSPNKCASGIILNNRFLEYILIKKNC